MAAEPARAAVPAGTNFRSPARAEANSRCFDEPEVVLDYVCLMEFFHYWTSGENSFYVELTDKEFLACVERERLWL